MMNPYNGRPTPDYHISWAETALAIGLVGVVAVTALVHKVAIVPEEPTVTWITTIPTNTPVDAGAKKLNLEIGIRADGVLVGALSTTASVTTNIKGEQTL